MIPGVLRLRQMAQGGTDSGLGSQVGQPQSTIQIRHGIITKQ